MEENDLSRAERVGGLGARLLAQPATIHLMSAVGVDTLTANEIALRLSMPLKRLWYRLTKLTEAGILEVAGERSRAGRPERLYRCRSTHYFVPAELRHSTIGSELATQLRRALAKAHSPAGELVSWKDGRFRVRKIADATRDGFQSSIELWGRAVLHPDQLPQLEREMRALLDRYPPKVPGDRDYLLHFAIAPSGSR